LQRSRPSRSRSFRARACDATLPSGAIRQAGSATRTGTGAANLAKTIPEGYRALRARIPGLQAQGIAVIDESALFDKLGDDIYSDDVAHVTEEGNRMLVREVANWLEQPH
jgi:hypothetical protein